MPSRSCPTCGGMGYVTYHVPVDHPDFGRAFVCHTCGGPQDHQVKRRQRLEKLFGAYWLHDTPKMSQFEIEDFTELAPDRIAGKAEAVTAIQYWARGEAVEYALLGLSGQPTAGAFVPSHSLVFAGVPGVGKTALACWGFRTRLAVAGVGLAIEYRRLMRAIQSHYSEGDADEVLDTVCQVPVLLLDDLRTDGANETDNKRALAFDLINYRYNYRLPTLITTNMTWERIAEQFSLEFAERLLEQYVWLNLGGVSLRLNYGT